MSVVHQNKWYVEPVPEEETEGWLLTYLDLITLLLVLLVVMLALSGKGSIKAEPTSAGLMPAHTGLLPGNPTTDSLPFPPDTAPIALATPAAPTSVPAPIAPATPTLVPAPTTTPAPASATDDAPRVAADASGSDISSPSTIVAQTEWDPQEYAPTLGGSDDTMLVTTLPDYFQSEADATALSRHLMGVPPDDDAADPEPSPPSEAGLDLLPLPELGEDIEIIRNRESISFRINSEILYSSAKADLSLEGLSVLRKLIPVLKESGYSITVEGHTDAVPVRRGQYPSNWELSGARAGRVVRYLAANGVPRDKLRAIGYADTKPLATNESDQGRARNRRVEIILEKQTLSNQ